MIVEPHDPDRHEPHAIVREEDVQLILTPDGPPAWPTASLDELESAALRAVGEPPGSVVVRAGRPLMLLAIVHDLGRDPSWTEEWILSATRAALRAARQRGLTRVAMPLLGTVHGRVQPARAARLLAEALCADPGSHPERLWIEEADPATVAHLRRRIE